MAVDRCRKCGADVNRHAQCSCGEFNNKCHTSLLVVHETSDKAEIECELYNGPEHGMKHRASNVAIGKNKFIDVEWSFSRLIQVPRVG